MNSTLVTKKKEGECVTTCLAWLCEQKSCALFTNWCEKCRMLVLNLYLGDLGHEKFLLALI